MSRRNDARSETVAMAIYVENGLLDGVAEAIASLEPCPFAGKVTADQIKIVLGEVGDVWPGSIRPTDRNGVVALFPRHGS